MTVDHAGVEQPPLQRSDAVDLIDSTPVVGIEVEDRAIAFVLEKMRDPKAHVVNLHFGQQTSVSVSYCSLVDCVRVLKDDSESPIPLHVGGLDIDNQMVFLLNGKRYGQMSAALPLEDYPYARTTWGAWKQQHPKTRICIPPSRASIEHLKRSTDSAT
ncbi:DUF3179 domain-containing (seleno)protein [Stieleria neptunia]|nr:DUF3179 domain-containing (seleno)protein [Stieleria neptunia]